METYLDTDGKIQTLITAGIHTDEKSKFKKLNPFMLQACYSVAEHDLCSVGRTFSECSGGQALISVVLLL